MSDATCQADRFVVPCQPYPSNPSFRPPPPLSNDLKDLIYSEVYTGGSSSSAVLSTLESLKSSSSPTADASLELQKRINQVSEEFGISKKRIEAVLKLKEHERGMKERGEVSFTATGGFCFSTSLPSPTSPRAGFPRRSIIYDETKYDITFVLKTSS